jgi:hypothetical protein
MTQEDGTTITVSGPGGISWHDLTQQFVLWLKGCSYHLPEGDAELIFDDDKNNPAVSLVELERAVFDRKTTIDPQTKDIFIQALEEMIEHLKEQT